MSRPVESGFEQPRYNHFVSDSIDSSTESIIRRGSPGQRPSIIERADSPAASIRHQSAIPFDPDTGDLVPDGEFSFLNHGAGAHAPSAGYAASMSSHTLTNGAGPDFDFYNPQPHSPLHSVTSGGNRNLSPFQLAHPGMTHSSSSTNIIMPGTKYEETQKGVEPAIYGVQGGANAGPVSGLGISQFGDPDRPSPMHTFSEKRSIKKARSRRWLWIILAVIALVIIAAVLIPVGLLVIHKNHKTSPVISSPSASNSPGSSVASGSASASSVTSSASPTTTPSIPASAKGTILDPSTWLDKTDFNTTYTNTTVGGLPVMGLNSTWDDSARANPHVPPLNEPFPYGNQPIRGVNLGGWFVFEPFITPSYFNYSASDNIIDEYTLSVHLNQTGGFDLVKNTIEGHYLSFANESTFKEISEAGLDHVRIPYPYWLIKTYPDDPYLPQVGWRYLLRAIEWARKYGLRVKLDFHSAPGSQNGWNHSGRQGMIGWLNGTDGALNGQRSLDLHDQISAFFAQDRYKNIVTIYGLMNEPMMAEINRTAVVEWTKQAYSVVRGNNITANIAFSDGFIGVQAWQGVFTPPQFTGMVMDLHQYSIFTQSQLQETHSAKLNSVCVDWQQEMSQATDPGQGPGPTMVGEWSQADNDCARWLNSVNSGSRWEGTFDVNTPSCPGGNDCTCDPSNSDPSSYSDAYKEFLLQFAEAQMQTFEQSKSYGFMYWTWDLEDATSSQWSYKKSRDAGTMPWVVYDRNFTCSPGAPTDFASLGLPETY